MYDAAKRKRTTRIFTAASSGAARAGAVAFILLLVLQGALPGPTLIAAAAAQSNPVSPSQPTNRARPSSEAGPSDTGSGAAPSRQVALTETDVENFIKMHAGLAKIADELEATGEDPDPQLRARLAALAKSSGFPSFLAYDTVADSILLVMSGIDPDTGVWSDPKIGLAEDIEDVKKDTTLEDAERKELIDDLEQAIKTTPDVAFPQNIPLVKKHAARIEKVLQ
ncbi:MAG: hypothetical protein AAFR55_01840 [Pseudomonadota bacterium]